MSSSDAFVIGADWISEHYFSTHTEKESFQRKINDRRKEWNEAETETVRSRFTAARLELERTLAGLMAGEDAGNSTAVSALYERLRQILGFTPPEYGLHRTGPVIEVQAPGITERAPLAIVEARPVSAVDDLLSKDADTLLTPYSVDEKTTLNSTSRLLSTLFVDADGPDFALVLAGRWALVAEPA